MKTENLNIELALELGDSRIRDMMAESCCDNDIIDMGMGEA
jgi:hypothetical protein